MSVKALTHPGHCYLLRGKNAVQWQMALFFLFYLLYQLKASLVAAQ